MKKTILSLSILITVSAAFAQQRMVFVEGFSQASCAPCAQQNPALNALLETNHSKVVSVKYQTSWPGVDPMNAQNPTEVQARVNYYNITGVPDRILDGVNTDITQAAVNTRYAVASPITLDVSHSLSADLSKASFNLTITAPEIWNPSNTVVHIAMVEKLIEFTSAPGTNGEKAFHNVMRKMYPSSAGTPIVAANFAAQNGTQTITLTDIAIPNYIYNLGEIGFVVWVQNNTTKEVYQAAFSEPVAVDNYATISAVATTQDYSCATDINDATVTIKNLGANDLTSATVNYKIDAEAPLSFPMNSGTITVGSTAEVTIPTINVTSGSHKLTVWLTGLNNQGDVKKFGETIKNFARITSDGTVGVVAQDFKKTPFPYTNQYVGSPTNTNWARVSANAGCLKFDAVAFSAGSTSSFYLAPVNMKTIEDDSLFFDVAHSYYSTFKEKLEVMLSKDCGATCTTVYTKQGTALATVPTSNQIFTPSQASHWRREGASIADFASEERVLVKFVATSGNGNNLYIDNIQMKSMVGINEMVTTLMSVYPNPTAGDTKVLFTGAGGTYTITLTDLSGRTLTTTNVEGINGVQTVDLATSGLSSGNYLVSIAGNGQVETQQLVIK